MRSPWPRGDLWRHGDFVNLWAAQTVSQLGSQVSQLALPLVAILVLEASAFEVALLGTMEFLPFLLVALPAGVWVDRLPRRPILVVADLGRAAALLSVPLAAVGGDLTIWQLYAVGLATGTLTVFFDAAYQSYLPALVERDQLVDGNSKLEASRSAAAVGGPGLGGVLVGAVTAPYAILADAVSFLLSALLLLRIRQPEPRPERAPGSSLRRELVEGLRYVLGDPRWRSIVGYVGSVNFFTTSVWALLLVYAVRSLELSAQLIGLVLALSNLGALAGAFAAGAISRRLGVGRTLVLSGILSGPPLLLIPLAPTSSPVPFLIAALLLEGLGIVIYNITAVSLIQALTPERLLGRMNASRRFLVWGTIPLGSLAGGALAASIGLRPTLFAGAAGASLSFLFLLFGPLRGLERIPEPEAVPTLL